MATKALKATPATASTTVALKKNNSVVDIKAQLAAQAAAMSDRITPPSGNKIKLAPNAMTLPDGTKTPGPIEVVIVDFIARNMFYEGDFDANNIQPPICFAIGANPKTMAPSPNSPQPQAKTCAECPMNAFGSKGNGKACKNERMLAVLPPDADADTPMWTASVSPTGIKGFDGYVGGVVRTFGTPPVGVITSMGLDDTKTYASLVFSEPAPNPNMAVHFARQDEAHDLLTVEPDLTARTAAKPAGKVAAKRPPIRR